MKVVLLKDISEWKEAECSKLTQTKWFERDRIIPLKYVTNFAAHQRNVKYTIVIRLTVRRTIIPHFWVVAAASKQSA